MGKELVRIFKIERIRVVQTARGKEDVTSGILQTPALWCFVHFLTILLAMLELRGGQRLFPRAWRCKFKFFSPRDSPEGRVGQEEVLFGGWS